MNKLAPVRLSEGEHALLALLREAGQDGAARALEETGLPTRRVEAYHYTDLKLLLRQIPDRLAKPAKVPAGRMLGGALGFRIVNGRLTGFDKLPASMKAVARRVEPAAGGDVPAMIAAALAPETVRINIGKSPGAPLHIDMLTDGPAAVSSGAVELVLGEGVEAVVYETHRASPAAHLAQTAMSVTLGKGAKLTHVLLDALPGAARQVAHLDYRLGADSRLRTLTVNAGAAVTRVNLDARFDGAGAHADFTGLNLSGGEQHHDTTLVISHAVPHTTSKELFKTVARDRAKAIVQGKIIVERGAQKTDAKLMAQGLMLSEGAEILHKPELEIFADDVVCGHGATCGALDETALFYLMSRGIPRAEAESMLIRAFLAELFEPIDNEALRAELEAVVDRWLGATRHADAA